MLKSLVSFGDLDLVFKITSNNDFCTKPIEADGELYLDLHECILWAR